MALKFSEMTARRVDLARDLEAGFTHYLEEIAGGYGEFVAPLLEEGETAPDIRFQLQLLQRGVAQRRQHLQDLTDGIVEQSHEDAKVRSEVIERMDALDGKLRLVRHVCRGIYGSEGVNRVGLKKEPPRSASRLHEHCVTVKASLQQSDLGLEPLISIDVGEGVATPAEQMAEQLEPELSELGELVDDRHQESRKGGEVRSRRRRVIGDFDHDIRAIVRMAQGLFRLVGRDDLAERFRPLLNRVARRKTSEEEEAVDQTADTPETTEPTETTETETPETTPPAS